MSNVVSLIVGTSKISGWTSVSIDHSLDTFASGFEFNMVDVWENEPPVLKPEKECVIDIDGTKVLTGFIDKVGIPVDATSKSYKVTGRSKTADLVDCSAANEPGSWDNITPLDIIEALVTPYGIRVTTDVALNEKIPNFTLNMGESPFDAIERICKDRGILCMTDADGDLVLTSAGRTRANDKLVYGINVLSAEATYDFSDRFQTYIVKGQKSGNGQSWKKTTNAVYGEASDPAILRERTKIFTADDEMTTSVAKKRAAWEAQVRAGRSGMITVNLSSWFQSNGSLWSPNILAACDISPLRVTADSPLLINEVKYIQDSGGTKSTLKLVREDTYAAEPKSVVKTKPKKKTDGFDW